MKELRAVCLEEIKQAAKVWVDEQRSNPRARTYTESASYFIFVAKKWLRFHRKLKMRLRYRRRDPESYNRTCWEKIEAVSMAAATVWKILSQPEIREFSDWTRCARSNEPGFCPARFRCFAPHPSRRLTDGKKLRKTLLRKRGLDAVQRLRITFGLVMLISFAVLGGVGYEAINNAPPMPSKVVPADGRVHFTYDSFGNLTASTATLGNPFQYTGRQFVRETDRDARHSRSDRVNRVPTRGDRASVLVRAGLSSEMLRYRMT